MNFYEKAGKVYLTGDDDRIYVINKDDFDVLMPEIEKDEIEDELEDEIEDQILKFYCVPAIGKCGSN